MKMAKHGAAQAPPGRTTRLARVALEATMGVENLLLGSSRPAEQPLEMMVGIGGAMASYLGTPL